MSKICYIIVYLECFWSHYPHTKYTNSLAMFNGRHTFVAGTSKGQRNEFYTEICTSYFLFSSSSSTIFIHFIIFYFSSLFFSFLVLFWGDPNCHFQTIRISNTNSKSCYGFARKDCPFFSSFFYFINIIAVRKSPLFRQIRA